MSNLTTQNAAQPSGPLSSGFATHLNTPSNGSGSLLQGNRHYISYTYPDQNWLGLLPPQMRPSLCLMSPHGGNQRLRPTFPPWLTALETRGSKHYNILRTESDRATCSREPSLEEGKELLTDAIWRVVEATGNTHLGVLTTAVQHANRVQIRIHIRRTTTFVDGSVESVEYHYTQTSFNQIVYQFIGAGHEIGRRDPAAKQWYVNLVDLIYRTTDRAYLEVMDASCWLMENFPDAQFYRAGPDYLFLDEGIVDLVLQYVGIDLIEEEGGAGPDRVCAICTELMRVDRKSNHFAVKLDCGHCFGVECIRRWLESPVTGLTSCPMCRKSIYIPSYADYHPENIPHNQPWDHIEVQLQAIEQIFASGHWPEQAKITEPAKFLLSLQYLIGVQLHANKLAVPVRYNPATFPETESMVAALCDYIGEDRDTDGFNHLLCTLCSVISQKIGADNGVSWDRHNWIVNSINDEWMIWAGRALKRALWMTMVWTVDDWPRTEGHHCVHIKRAVNLRYPRLQQKMEELDSAFALGVGSLERGCGPLISNQTE